LRNKRKWVQKVLREKREAVGHRQLMKILQKKILDAVENDRTLSGRKIAKD
jgi:hypothetical protein